MMINEKKFLDDVKDHEMKILRDDGLYRHIRFQKPSTYNKCFELITWPGKLCYTGNMGTYVFSRIQDMFEFFRRPESEYGDKEVPINADYWGEKLDAVCERGGYKEFDHDYFNENVIRYLISWFRENYHQTTKDERRNLWEDIVSIIILNDDKNDKQEQAYRFFHEVNSDVGGFSFSDPYENLLVGTNKFTYSFLWCCYAISWGVHKYNIWTENNLKPCPLCGRIDHVCGPCMGRNEENDQS